MSSSSETTPTVGRAEKAFREAFERLKCGTPQRVSKGTPVSQNNVAKEAGCDPSALRKSRYPSLISEIQRWIEDHAPDAPPSPRKKLLAQRSRNRSLRETIDAQKAQRDHALSLLVEADAKILDLTIENARLTALLPSSNVTPIRGTREDG
jgi:hypothetical protein